VTCSTVDGPVQALYIRGPPPTGLTSVRPAHQVFVSQPIEPSGSFLRVLAGPVGILRPPVGNVERVWGEASARSNLQPEFDASQVASRPEDRAVDTRASGERYLNHGSASGAVVVNRADTYSQESHGARPKKTMESQQMDPAGMETGLTGMQPVPGASVPSSGPAEVGHVMPGDLRQPCLPSEAHIVHPPGMDVQSMGAPAPCPVAQGDQVVGHKWVRNPSCVSGLSRSHLLLMWGKVASSLKPGECAMPYTLPKKSRV